ncbi:MAG: tRNA guanosine(34) transglycosylase Tgt [Proteobacteria bacterium]|nr:tRNA guanosine(34) transglycosylase Tgt [Pseudomonadota bacterium]
MFQFPFTVQSTDGPARAGTLKLRRGTVETPVFMPVGTQGAIRGLTPLHLSHTGTQIILANTYHLSQRPGERIVEKHGGLHKMMGIDLPILTDSGGFQVFSLKKTVTEEGVHFAYELDGKKTFLSSERSMEIQQALGSDIAMVFDECLPYGSDEETTAKSIERTARWEARSKEAHHRSDQSLFGIVQGGFFPKLRKRSAAQIQEIGFDGYAIGGLSVGEGHSQMCRILDVTTPHLTEERPRYLMGVGRPLDLVEGVARGIDMFDCVIQTRHSRSGIFYTSRGRIRITDSRYRSDFYAPDPSCQCYTCTNFTRAYLNHLFRIGDILSATLATIHNLTWFAKFMKRMRQSIIEHRFDEFRKEVHQTYPESQESKSNKKSNTDGKRGSQGSRKKRNRTKRSRK